MKLHGILVALLFGIVTPMTIAQDVATEDPTNSEKVVSDEAAELQEIEKLFAEFGALLHKSALVGTFTIDGDKEFKARSERYEITKVVKQAQGDYWNFFARIQYGKYDVKLPIPVEVKWAGTTPVITVDNLTIPGMGTFDARVVISDNKYAGTWRHGKVGGLMYGHIEKLEETKQPEPETAPVSAE